MVGTAALKNTVPEPESVEYLRGLMINLSGEVLEWQNRQNVNRFEAEPGQPCQEYSKVL